MNEKQGSVLLQCLQISPALTERLFRISLASLFPIHGFPGDHTSVALTLLFLLVAVGSWGLPRAGPLRLLHPSHTRAHLSRSPIYSLHSDAYLLILTFPR